VFPAVGLRGSNQVVAWSKNRRGEFFILVPAPSEMFGVDLSKLEIRSNITRTRSCAELTYLCERLGLQVLLKPECCMRKLSVKSGTGLPERIGSGDWYSKDLA
jgi:hypothetical protein